MESAEGPAGLAVVAAGLCRRGPAPPVGVGHAIPFPEPPTEVDQPAPLRTERVVRVLGPVRRHAGVANRARRLIHRPFPTQTSGFFLLAVLLALPGTTLLLGRGRRRRTRRGAVGFGSLGRLRVRFRRVGLLRVLVRLAPVIRFVEPRPLEQYRRPAAEQAAEFLLLALRALCQGVVLERLPLLELVAAGVADVVVSRHKQNLF